MEKIEEILKLLKENQDLESKMKMMKDTIKKNKETILASEKELFSNYSGKILKGNGLEIIKSDKSEEEVDYEKINFNDPKVHEIFDYYVYEKKAYKVSAKKEFIQKLKEAGIDNVFVEKNSIEYSERILNEPKQPKMKL